jgi:hypothetical protein
MLKVLRAYCSWPYWEELAARASDIIIMSKPVRQGMLFQCLAQLHIEGVFRTPSASDDVLNAMPRLKHKHQQHRRDQSAEALPALGGAGGSDSSLERRHERRLRVLVVDDNSTSRQSGCSLRTGTGPTLN